MIVHLDFQFMMKKCKHALVLIQGMKRRLSCQGEIYKQKIHNFAVISKIVLIANLKQIFVIGLTILV